MVVLQPPDAERAVCATGVGRRGYNGEHQRKRVVAALYVACAYVALYGTYEASIQIDMLYVYYYMRKKRRRR